MQTFAIPPLPVIDPRSCKLEYERLMFKRKLIVLWFVHRRWSLTLITSTAHIWRELVYFHPRKSVIDPKLQSRIAEWFDLNYLPLFWLLLVSLDLWLDCWLFFSPNWCRPLDAKCDEIADREPKFSRTPTSNKYSNFLFLERSVRAALYCYQGRHFTLN